MHDNPHRLCGILSNCAQRDYLQDRSALLTSLRRVLQYRRDWSKGNDIRISLLERLKKITAHGRIFEKAACIAGSGRVREFGTPDIDDACAMAAMLNSCTPIR